MSARQKFGVVYLNGALIIAALVDMGAERWAACWIVLVIAAVGRVSVGDTRP